MREIVAGTACGTVLRSEKPINFLGAVDKETGVVRDRSHELYGRKIGGSILVFPHGIGSSVGAYTIYALKACGVAPAAMVCLEADITISSGCALADIPLVVASEEEYEGLKDGEEATVG